ncbi:MAG: hypothetical protein NZT92_15360 [Abditibacteriales bacterium]|nr:hypothetical protein [Abditibacteriales bacterium]MDW8367322.1 hypothetical protein [Abditibacteriales bacterium]
MALLLGSFTLGVWVAAWAECVPSYNNCGYEPPVEKMRRSINLCTQDSGPPNCVCCEYYVRYYDLNGDRRTDCVIVQTITHEGDWECDAERISCSLKTCNPTPSPSPPPNPSPE